MPLEKIRVYEVEITGHLTLQAKNDAEALEVAHQFVIDEPKVLNYAITGHDGYEVVAPPPPP